jgi:Holliday junction resolvase-like predicted endonuclease
LLVVIEVKYVDTIQELDNYISPKKIWHLTKALESFLWKTNGQTFDEIRMDAVFVKNGNIIERYENITNE